MPVTSKEYDQDLAGEQYEETDNEEQENRAIRDSRCLAEGNSEIELRWRRESHPLNGLVGLF